MYPNLNLEKVVQGKFNKKFDFQTLIKEKQKKSPHHLKVGGFQPNCLHLLVPSASPNLFTQKLGADYLSSFPIKISPKTTLIIIIIIKFFCYKITPPHMN